MLVRNPARQVLFILLTAALALTSCNMGATPAPTMDVNAINTAAFNTAMAQISAGQTQTALAAPSITSLPTNTPLSLATFASGDTAVPGAAAALPTVSFNTSPNTTANTTPLAGLTPLVVGSPAVPAAVAPTAALGDACSNNQFVADVTIPDGQVFEAGTDFKPGHDFQKIWRVKNTGNCKWDDGFSLAFVGGDDALEPYTFNFKDASDFVDPGETADLGLTLFAPSAAGKYAATWRMKNDQGQYFGTPLTVMIEVRKH